MKISKLFHWLYGAVMLLPLFAIGVTCGYAMFNKNAFKSYKDEQILNVEYSNDFVYQEQYYYKCLEGNIYGTLRENNASITAYNFNINNTIYNNVKFWFYGETDIRLQIYILDLDTNTRIVSGGSLTEYVFSFNYLETTFTSSNYSLVKDFFTYKNERTIDNVFYYSIDKVMESDIFSWSYDSFLVAPFTYIVTLFSMPTDSVIVMLLSYWLAISIIWLVFDLVMYVPMLVHRWIDKGVLE